MSNYPKIQFVVNNEFNQAHSSSYIGTIYRPYDNLPSYVMLKNLPETLEHGFRLLDENYKRATPFSDRYMVRILIDELGLTKNIIDLMLQHWATKAVPNHMMNMSQDYTEWIITQCAKPKI